MDGWMGGVYSPRMVTALGRFVVFLIARRTVAGAPKKGHSGGINNNRPGIVSKLTKEAKNDSAPAIYSAADVCRKLSEGFQELPDDVRDLSEAVRELSDVVGELADDVRELSSDVRELSDDVRELSDSARELATDVSCRVDSRCAIVLVVFFQF